MTYVLDASAMIALFNNEPGANVVSAILVSTGATVYAHDVNLCEFAYWAIRNRGEADALVGYASLLALGVKARADMDQSFWWMAAEVKASHKMALGDAFVIALTLRVDGELVTSDHRELEPVAAARVCRIQFFR